MNLLVYTSPEGCGGPCRSSSRITTIVVITRDRQPNAGRDVLRKSVQEESTVTQNPKTVSGETRGKLGRKSWRGDEDDAQEGTHGGADRSGIAAGGSR